VSKPFLIDSLHDTHVSYEKLAYDVTSKKSIEEPFDEEFECSSLYELYVWLVAALASNATIAMLQSGKIRFIRVNPVNKNEPTSIDSLVEACGRSQALVGILTSGTTDQPKLIWHTLETLVRSVRVDRSHRDDVWGLTYHPSHFAGLQIFFQAFFNRNTIVNLRGLSPAPMSGAIKQLQVSHISSTPTFMRLVCSQRDCFPKVQRVSLGGEICTEATLGLAKNTFPNAKIHNLYASTDAGQLLISDGNVFLVPREFAEQFQVIDGELAVHRSLLAKSLREIVDTDFYLTGDLVRVHQESPLTIEFLGRRTDEINVGGFKVNPLEVEAAILAMDEVVDARVYGCSNSVTGQVVGCDIVKKVDADLPTPKFRSRLAEQFPAYKIPRIIQWVDRLPSTSSGKKQRRS
jgi:acyl-coenzyme A synthetase/AMP-(fatty) acid ligase